ncbi:hypothetical protein RchiOBHm_Chr7g0187011 [Rosa chinensis]|uniref:Uncharacterized protein n=1 Tax=Rosa chinensis TaxID=74649 RepID=A0A2P6P442_ROSCH|nr:hypothetical protein RchiOBHm_Chr7g0187011 [Rosa chinensis]
MVLQASPNIYLPQSSPLKRKRTAAAHPNPLPYPFSLYSSLQPHTTPNYYSSITLSPTLPFHSLFHIKLLGSSQISSRKIIKTLISSWVVRSIQASLVFFAF